jgi:hypothetical protein
MKVGEEIEIDIEEARALGPEARILFCDLLAEITAKGCRRGMNDAEIA